jgi:hypothetical protein
VAVTAKSADAMGPGEREVWSSLPHASFDVVIMNPPFTRATGQEGRKLGVPNPMFAAFSSTEEEQRLMGRATSQLTKGTSAHGNAGEASIFLVLADRKLKPDGTLALVMPLSLLCGDAWEKSRRLLAKGFNDLVLVSIAAADDAALSFSADTGMGECLVVGRKDDKGSKRATFVILKERPKFPMVGASASTQIRRLIAEGGVRRLEDGPVGGPPIPFGEDIVGYAMSAPLPADDVWNLSRIADLSLAQVAYQLAERTRVWLPGTQENSACRLPISRIGKIGTIGPYHADINWTNANGTIRGPFEILPVVPGTAPTYPVLWTNDAPTQRTLKFEADSEGQAKQGRTAQERDLINRKLAQICATASHAHFNRDFRFNSQATGMQFTSRRTIGGRAWISIKLKSEDQEKALVAWGNTSFGLLLHWWHSNKQQSGRGSIGKLALEDLPVHDVTSLTPAKLKTASAVFDNLRDKPLLPFHEIDKDPVRRQLDERFGREVLGLPAELFQPDGPLELLRMKLAREPSIRGSK